MFTHFFVCLSLKLLKLGEIDGVKLLAWKSGGVKFWTNLMSGPVNYKQWKQINKLINELCIVSFCGATNVRLVSTRRRHFQIMLHHVPSLSERPYDQIQICDVWDALAYTHPLAWFSVALDFWGTLYRIWYFHSPQALEVIASSSGGKRILWHLIRVCKFDVKQLMKNRGGENSGKHLVQEEEIKHRGEIEEIILDM